MTKWEARNKNNKLIKQFKFVIGKRLLMNDKRLLSDAGRKTIQICTLSIM